MPVTVEQHEPVELDPAALTAVTAATSTSKKHWEASKALAHEVLAKMNGRA